MDRNCILVIGMHRSGTSCMTGTLQRCNVTLNPENRDTLNKWSWENPKGFFEHTAFIDVHKKIFQKYDRKWYNVDDEFVQTMNNDYLVYKEYIKNNITEYFKNEKLFAIKDPKITLMSDIYISACSDLNIQLNIIRMNRLCAEVAQSLKRRNNFSLDKGINLCSLYKKYGNKFYKKLDDNNRVRIDFDDLITYPIRVINKIKSKLNLDLVINNEAIKEFIDPDLKRHNYKSR